MPKIGAVFSGSYKYAKILELYRFKVFDVQSGDFFDVVCRPDKTELVSPQGGIVASSSNVILPINPGSIGISRLAYVLYRERYSIGITTILKLFPSRINNLFLVKGDSGVYIAFIPPFKDVFEAFLNGDTWSVEEFLVQADLNISETAFDYFIDQFKDIREGVFLSGLDDATKERFANKAFTYGGNYILYTYLDKVFPFLVIGNQRIAFEQQGIYSVKGAAIIPDERTLWSIAYNAYRGSSGSGLTGYIYGGWSVPVVKGDRLIFHKVEFRQPISFSYDLVDPTQNQNKVVAFNVDLPNLEGGYLKIPTGHIETHIDQNSGELKFSMYNDGVISVITQSDYLWYLDYTTPPEERAEQARFLAPEGFEILKNREDVAVFLTSYGFMADTDSFPYLTYFYLNKIKDYLQSKGFQVSIYSEYGEPTALRSQASPEYYSVTRFPEYGKSIPIYRVVADYEFINWLNQNYINREFPVLYPKATSIANTSPQIEKIERIEIKLKEAVD